MTAEQIQEKINKSYVNGKGNIHPLLDQPVDLEESLKNTAKKLIEVIGTNWVNKKKKDLLEHHDHIIYLLKWSLHWRDGWTCSLCGNTKPFDDTKQIDHIIPKSKFPCSHPWNLQTTCADCNYEKSTQLLDAVPIYLNGAIMRSKIFFKNESQFDFTNRMMNGHYKTVDHKNEELYLLILSEISQSPNKWVSISKLIDKRLRV